MNRSARAAPSFLCAIVVLGGCQASVPSQALPHPVTGQFQHDYPEARIKKVDRLPQEDGTTHYRIEFLNRYHYPREATFDQDGKFVSGDRELWVHPRP